MGCPGPVGPAPTLHAACLLHTDCKELQSYAACPPAPGPPPPPPPPPARAQTPVGVRGVGRVREGESHNCPGPEPVLACVLTKHEAGPGLFVWCLPELNCTSGFHQRPVRLRGGDGLGSRGASGLTRPPSRPRSPTLAGPVAALRFPVRRWAGPPRPPGPHAPPTGPAAILTEGAGTHWGYHRGVIASPPPPRPD